MAEAVTVGATLRTGWPVLVIPSAIYFVSHFHRIALGVVTQDLMRAFTITAATLGALAAIYPYVFVAMALVAGSLADTLGPRRTLGAGALAMGLGALVFGLAPSFSVVVLGRRVGHPDRVPDAGRRAVPHRRLRHDLRAHANGRQPRWPGRRRAPGPPGRGDRLARELRSDRRR